MRSSASSRHPFRHHPILWSVLGGLVVFRLLLPFVILRVANKRLAELPDYYGHIEGIHLALWRGTFELKDLTLKHTSNDIQLTINRIVMNLLWSSLIKRKIIITLWIEQPSLLVVTKKTQKTATKSVPKINKPTASPKNDYRSLPDSLGALVPFQIAWFELNGGRVVVRPQETSHPDPKVQTLPPNSQFEMSNLDVKVSNLTNARKVSGLLTAEGFVTARLMKDGHLKMGLRINPLAQTPTFDMTFVIEKFDLRELNPVLDWQYDLLVKQGLFELYTGASAANGGFEGYVKPFVGDLMIDNPNDKRGPIQMIKKVTVNAVATILKNHHTEKVATNIPFKGRFDNPQVGLWEAVLNILRNAFFTAIEPHLG